MLNSSQKIKELKAEVERLKSSVNELKILNEIALSTGRATDIDEILNLIVHKCVSVFEAEQGSILLLTKNEKEPFKTIIRQDDSSNLKHTYHIGSNITGWVLLHKEPLIIEKLAGDNRFNPTAEEKKDIHSVLCVPIWYEGEITGLMMLVNKKDQKKFLSDELTLFTIISVQAGQLIKNLQLQREYFQKIKETEKLKELDKLKTSFFANISHEFRTPLTLILGPAEQILDLTENDTIRDNASLIRRSAKKLNKLADELLDLARIEAGMMTLKAARKDLKKVMAEIVQSFQHFAAQKDIALKFIFPPGSILIYLDMNKFEKIVNNILSNALKFTPRNGCVKVEVQSPSYSGLIENEMKGGYAEILISDTGLGIPKEQVKKIFDRFYRIENRFSDEYEGTGIGLSLTKELVELHKGKIIVESEEGKGSSFKILLPLGKDHLKDEEIEDEKIINKIDDFQSNVYEMQFDELNKSTSDDTKDFKIGTDLNEDLPTLLITEDNSDLRKYVSEILQGEYKIIEAADGEDGLTKAFNHIPDIIISDIMMPKMDGFQLCSKLKADFRTSHIPIIILTAKATIKDKVEGFETGADAYIMKPFEAEELKARIINLLQQRRRVHDYFKSHGLIEINESGIASADKKFLTNAIEIINEHIPDTSFGVEAFAEHLAVSRSLLHKKLTALTGESPGELIKRYRLNKAAKMLEQRTGSITQIAFEVGFNDASYFTLCFRTQFGISPSQYHKNNS